MTADPPGGAPISVDEIQVAADPAAWSAAGFRVEDDVACVGATRVRLAGSGAGRGITGWSLRGLRPCVPDGEWSLDGLGTSASHAPAAVPARHPNGASAVDHVVALTPDLDRTVSRLRNVGLDLRRVREGRLPGGGTRQAFFRVGEPILEVIEQPLPDGRPAESEKPARLWGIAFLTPDLDATVAGLGYRVGPAREAVQPGRRIATVRGDAGLAAAVAFITPRQRR